MRLTYSLRQIVLCVAVAVVFAESIEAQSAKRILVDAEAELVDSNRAVIVSELSELAERGTLEQIGPDQMLTVFKLLSERRDPDELRLLSKLLLYDLNEGKIIDSVKYPYMEFEYRANACPAYMYLVDSGIPAIVALIEQISAPIIIQGKLAEDPDLDAYLRVYQEELAAVAINQMEQVSDEEKLATIVSVVDAMDGEQRKRAVKFYHAFIGSSPALSELSESAGFRAENSIDSKRLLSDPLEAEFSKEVKGDARQSPTLGKIGEMPESQRGILLYGLIVLFLSGGIFLFWRLNRNK